jgi:hypothetical protein
MTLTQWKLQRAKGKLQNSSAKRDETRAISVLVGMFLGSALGLPISIALGLLGSSGKGMPSYDFSGNLMFFSSLFSFSVLFGCLIAFVTCAYLWKKEESIKLAHCAISSLTLLSLWISLFLLFTFLFVPFDNFLLNYLTPVSVLWYVALAFFPFVVIIAYVQYPTLRPRIRHQSSLLLIRRFWSEIGRNPRKHTKMLLIYIGLTLIIIADVLKALYG